MHLVFAERLRIWRFKDRFYRRAFGVHALACAGFLAAAVPLWVEREWLPVLWSLLLPLTAWFANKIEEPWLRRGLWIGAPAVLIAVLVSGFPAGDRPIFNWLAYGLGVPTLSFAATAWLVRRASDLRLMLLLQAGALILGFLLVTLEIRHLFHGARSRRAVRLCRGRHADPAVGRAGAGIWRMAQRRGEARLRWIAYGLALAAALLTIGVVWGLANPLLLRSRSAACRSSTPRSMSSAAGLRCSWRWRTWCAAPSSMRATPCHQALAAAIALVDGLLGVSALNRHLFQGAFIVFDVSGVGATPSSTATPSLG